MTDILLTNTLTRKKEKFTPIKKKEIGVYSCGPTVYWDQHIGHMYAYVQWDILVRFLKYVGYDVNWVMNITDVGHLTSDEDTGEDKMEKGAKREGITVWDLAEKYIKQFEESLKLLNITTPNTVARVTDNIEEQIKLIGEIEKKGFTYKTKMGIVFDTSKFSDYEKFGKLDLKNLKQREDIKDDPEKKNPSDFFLWITGNKKHVMQWDSPWGKGYPGWHIECTAISTKYLGKKFDIHTGGVEHIPVHHTNEIAQGYGAFDDITANFWLHNAWLNSSKGEKMSKSLGNFVTAQGLKEKGYDPLALRYLILTSHYKKGLNFSFEALDAAQTALNKLKSMVSELEQKESRTALSEEKQEKIEKYQEKFKSALSDDLNTPQALAVVWEMIKSNIPGSDKLELALSFDEVLGLNLNFEKKSRKVTDEVKKLIAKRELLRKEGKFEESDKLRSEIEDKGYDIKDTKDKTVVQKK